MISQSSTYVDAARIVVVRVPNTLIPHDGQLPQLQEEVFVGFPEREEKHVLRLRDVWGSTQISTSESGAILLFQDKSIPIEYVETIIRAQNWKIEPVVPIIKYPNRIILLLSNGVDIMVASCQQ